MMLYTSATPFATNAHTLMRRNAKNGWPTFGNLRLVIYVKDYFEPIWFDWLREHQV